MMRRVLVAIMAGLVLPVMAGLSEETRAADVSFKTSEPAPSGFTFWTFYWTMPEVEPDAQLQYVVRQPDGKEYFRYTIAGPRQTGQGMRSDFSKEFAGGDPAVFYGKHIVFTFMVNKGSITFPENPQFRFEFRNSVQAVRDDLK